MTVPPSFFLSWIKTKQNMDRFPLETRTQEIALSKLEILTSVSSLNNFMCASNNVVREQENQVFNSNTPSVPEISNQTWTKLSSIAHLLQKVS